VTRFLPLTELFAFSHSRTLTLSLLRSRPTSLSCVFANEDSSINFTSSAMAHVKSTARFVGAAASSADKGHESEGSAERTESTQLNDVGSHDESSDDTDEGSHTRSFYFGPSTVTVSRIHGMIDNDYFAEGMARELREETVPEPNGDEVVVFVEFFTAGLRMPPHPVLSDILLKFQVQIYQLTPNTIV
jgi:hypothetical protein